MTCSSGTMSGGHRRTWKHALAHLPPPPKCGECHTHCLHACCAVALHAAQHASALSWRPSEVTLLSLCSGSPARPYSALPGRTRHEGRNQLVLDLTREEVREHIFESIAVTLRGANICYVKWDMNRHLTEAFSVALPRLGEELTAGRYYVSVKGQPELCGSYEISPMLVAISDMTLAQRSAAGRGAAPAAAAAAALAVAGGWLARRRRSPV